MRTLVKYRIKGTEEVQTEDLTNEEAHHWTRRNWLYPNCDYLEFVTVDWDWVVDMPDGTKKIVPVDTTPSYQKKATEVQSRPELVISLSGMHKDSIPTSASAPNRVLRRNEDVFKISLVCKRSGLPLGDFVPSQGLAVATPYVQAWKETSYLHPVFSLSLGTLITRAEACWQLEKSGTRQFPMQHKQLLFLAMLHASGCVKQDVAGLPSPKIVETHFPRLIELLGWKYEMASDRVQFPKLHVWRGAAREEAGNLFGSVPTWLDVVESVKAEYENVSRERQKAAKAKAHDLALKSIRKQMYSDVSLKRLWNWYKSQVPQMVQETNEELEQLFFCEEIQIHVWDAQDIEALESIFLKYCETGTSVSFEFAKRLRQLTEFLNTYNDTFEIVEPKGDQYAAYRGVPAPKRADFPNGAAFLIASARWQLANKAVSVSKVAGKKTQGEDL